MKVKKAVIPAAGLGTRVLPATKAMPKEMLTIVDKPAIQYIVEEAVKSGIEDICIILSRGKNVVEDHFDRAPELEQKLADSGKQMCIRDSQSPFRSDSGPPAQDWNRSARCPGIGRPVQNTDSSAGNLQHGRPYCRDMLFLKLPLKPRGRPVRSESEMFSLQSPFLSVTKKETEAPAAPVSFA